MPRQYHELKTETQYYQAAEQNKKTFELRMNDRNFQLGDYVTLVEVVNGTPTGRKLKQKQITYILEGPIYGLQEGYCILQLD
jgi:Domain of unknown function (DUF3850)